MKKDYKVVLIGILAICFIVSLLFNFYLGFKGKEIHRSLGPNEVKNKQLVCEKKETSNDASNTLKYIIDVEEDGSILEYELKFISDYYNDETYNTYKQLSVENSIMTYDDNAKQIIHSYEKMKFKDEQGNEVTVWYVDYQSQLESDGYHCSLEK